MPVPPTQCGFCIYNDNTRNTCTVQLYSYVAAIISMGDNIHSAYLTTPL